MTSDLMVLRRASVERPNGVGYMVITKEMLRDLAELLSYYNTQLIVKGVDDSTRVMLVDRVQWVILDQLLGGVSLPKGEVTVQ
ncbi:MAG: hypothetical protein QXZ09_05555 [Candidatus Methanomethylicaceae archaeon]